MFEVIDKNKRKTIFIVSFFVLLLSGVIWSIGYVNNIDMYLMVPVAFGISIFASIISYYNSDKIVLAVSGARRATEEEHKYIISNLEGLCIAAGLSNVPRLYIIDDSAPNAFATGRNPENSVICLTTGIIEKLDMYELEGVLAHELAHIKNYDILLSTIVTVMVGMIGLLSDFFLRSMGRSRRRSEDDNKGNGLQAVFMLVGVLLLILAPIISRLMKLALSRNREYLADATAVEFTRNPEGLMHALAKISGDDEALEVANRATANLYIVSPLKGNQQVSWIDKLYATHPPIQDRIDALSNLY